MKTARGQRGSPTLVEIGDVFGRWTVLGSFYRRPDGMAVFPCRCACGTEREVIYRSLRQAARGGYGQSCGCLQREVMATKSIHGRRMTRAENWVWQNYGLSPDEFNAMYDMQGGRCAICAVTFAEEKPHVDHDHATRRVRSLLCQHCNKGLGHFRDQPALLRRAAEYLDSVMEAATVLD